MENEKFLSKLLLNLNHFVWNKLRNNLEDDRLLKPENLLEIDYYISMWIWTTNINVQDNFKNIDK